MTTANSSFPSHSFISLGFGMWQWAHRPPFYQSMFRPSFVVKGLSLVGQLLIDRIGFTEHVFPVRWLQGMKLVFKRVERTQQTNRCRICTKRHGLGEIASQRILDEGVPLHPIVFPRGPDLGNAHLPIGCVQVASMPLRLAIVCVACEDCIAGPADGVQPANCH